VIGGLCRSGHEKEQAEERGADMHDAMFLNRAGFVERSKETAVNQSACVLWPTVRVSAAGADRV
jgi:hypothetical protein